MTGDLQQDVALSADAAGLHANVPTLLLELQTLLGAATASVTATTHRGRVPYRPGPEWTARIGELAYGVYLLADQTNVSIEQAVRATADQLRRRGEQAAAASDDWSLPS